MPSGSPQVSGCSDQRMTSSPAMDLLFRPIEVQSLKSIRDRGGHVGVISATEKGGGDMAGSSNENEPPQPTRRLIKADFSLLDSLDDDDDDDFILNSPKENGHHYHFENEGSKSTPASTPSSPWHRTALDLTTQCRRGSGVILRRHTIAVTTPTQQDRRKRPHSFTNGGSLDYPYILPRSSCSRTSLQEEFFRSNHWQQAVDCLSLTLEEVVHIRNVLTKAELESLPVDCSLKEDVEKSKVCFLCLKTRFSIFGPWGHKCKLCKRTVCAKCCSKMRIPTEHFSKVPVFTLSPNLSPREEEKESFTKAIMSKLVVPDVPTVTKNSVGSAPPSPNLTSARSQEDQDEGRGTKPSSEQSEDSEEHESPQSLPSLSSVSLGILRMKTKYRASRAKAAVHKSKMEEVKVEKLKGSLMNVCHDCKTMVLQIIRSSRAKRSDVLKQMSLNLNPVY